MILFQAGEFDILYSEVSMRRGSPIKPTNLHDLQLTLYLIIVAILFELLFEVNDFDGLHTMFRVSNYAENVGRYLLTKS